MQRWLNGIGANLFLSPCVHYIIFNNILFTKGLQNINVYENRAIFTIRIILPERKKRKSNPLLAALPWLPSTVFLTCSLMFIFRDTIIAYLMYSRLYLQEHILLGEGQGPGGQRMNLENIPSSVGVGISLPNDIQLQKPTFQMTQ